MGSISDESPLSAGEISPLVDRLRDALSEGDADDGPTNAELLRQYGDQFMIPASGRYGRFSSYARVLAESAIAMEPSELRELERLAFNLVFSEEARNGGYKYRRMDAAVELYLAVRAVEPMVSETYGPLQRSSEESEKFRNLETELRRYRIERLRGKVQDRARANVERPFLMPNDRKELIDVFASTPYSERLRLLTEGDYLFATGYRSMFNESGSFKKELTFLSEAAKFGLSPDVRLDELARETLAFRVLRYVEECAASEARSETSNMFMPPLDELFPAALFGDLRSNDTLRQRLGSRIQELFLKRNPLSIGEGGALRYQARMRLLAGMLEVSLPMSGSVESAAHTESGPSRPVSPPAPRIEVAAPSPSERESPPSPTAAPDRAKVSPGSLRIPPERPAMSSRARDLLARMSDRTMIGALVSAIELDPGAYEAALGDSVVASAAAARLADLVREGMFADIERRARVLLGDGWNRNETLRRAVDERTRLESKIESGQGRREASMRGIVHAKSARADIRRLFFLE